MAEEEKQGVDSLNFKLSIVEKKKITDEAAKLDISISEYVRIKSLSDENDVITVRVENRKLKKELLELKVKNSFYKKTDRTVDGVFLNICVEDQELFIEITNEDILLKFKPETIEERIKGIISCYFLNDMGFDNDEDNENNEYQDSVFRKSGYTYAQVEEIFRNVK